MHLYSQKSGKRTAEEEADPTLQPASKKVVIELSGTSERLPSPQAHHIIFPDSPEDENDVETWKARLEKARSKIEKLKQRMATEMRYYVRYTHTRSLDDIDEEAFVDCYGSEIDDVRRNHEEYHNTKASGYATTEAFETLEDAKEAAETFWDEFEDEQEGDLIDDEGVPDMDDNELTPNSWQREWYYKALEGPDGQDSHSEITATLTVYIVTEEHCRVCGAHK